MSRTLDCYEVMHVYNKYSQIFMQMTFEISKLVYGSDTHFLYDVLCYILYDSNIHIMGNFHLQISCVIANSFEMNHWNSSLIHIHEYSNVHLVGILRMKWGFSIVRAIDSKQKCSHAV